MQIALIHSGVTGTEQFYQGDRTLHYRSERITAGWQPCFDAGDVVLVPNGANHVALYEARARLHRFLERGGPRNGAARTPPARPHAAAR